MHMGSESELVTFFVSAEDHGKRLDVVLASLLDGHSRSRCQALIRTGALSIDGATISEPKYRVKQDQQLCFAEPAPTDADPEPQDIPLNVLFEDDAIIVIDKPAGMVVHPAASVEKDTLVNALLFHCGDSLKGIGGVKRPGIVHRLDKDTSGVMIAAKTDEAHRSLSAQFADHGKNGPLRRTYNAFVWGVPDPEAGTIDAMIGRSTHNRTKQAIVEKNGRHAVTHYKTLMAFGGNAWTVSKIACQLETGRTHQIRVHLAHIGHALLGDPTYGIGFESRERNLPMLVQKSLKSLSRQALHAVDLTIAHPVSGAKMHFSSPVPTDMENLEKTLQTADS
ncbi:RluA family pseudouridine synthase [Maritalea porphyrae]|uniref:RluA family pseudouridine synthase n=1 Tax=Maritalea porphyrae TaxID=880732 RepID=UPI0022B04786|nr:RluA family pseudouridine synthase [Maritalea porphyrae]MCZ4273645.1 RluA family pseudouridine synthase [Maritalea porphyrae]